MRIGVVSDSHGNRRLLFQAADLLLGAHGATQLIHLGDDYEDAEELQLAGYVVNFVPGLWCAAYRNAAIPNTRVEDYDGVRIGYAHTPEEVMALRRQAAILLHGHTHHPTIQQDARGVVMNPGHLKAPRDRGYPASCGLIVTSEEAVDLYLYLLDNTPLQHKHAPRADLPTFELGPK